MKSYIAIGVDLRLGAIPEKFIGDEQLQAVQLADGETIDCDAALVGIGAVPEASLAMAAGLEVENGILVDKFCRARDAGIWAAGLLQPSLTSLPA